MHSWPKVPEKYKLGDISSIAIDAQDNAYVLHRPRTLKAENAGSAAPPVVVFDANGNFIKAWGGPGAGYEWVEREHGIHIDHGGFAWIGGNQCPTSGTAGLMAVADDQLLKFSLDGKFVLQIGKSNQSKGDGDTANVHRAADAWVRANEVFVADGYGNHRVIVFDADTGAFKRTWGAFGKPPGGKDNCAISRLTEFAPGDGLPDFNVAHSIRVSNDGMVYLADRENRRVQMFTGDGKFVRQLRQTAAPFAANLAFVARSGAEISLCWGRQGDHHRGPQDARRPGSGPGGEAARRRSPHRNRLQGQSLHRGDRNRHAAAVVQRDVGGVEIKSRLLSTVIARRLALGLFSFSFDERPAYGRRVNIREEWPCGSSIFRVLSRRPSPP